MNNKRFTSLYSAHILQSQIVACFDVDRASILHEEQTFYNNNNKNNNIISL